MTSTSSRKLHYLSTNIFPIFLLFFLVLVDFDFSFHSKKFVTFNLIYVIIYYWVLKNPENLGYGLVFFAGVINDIVTGLPIGISSIDYLILCGIASYFRNITLRPSLINDWIAFIPAIFIINSIHYSILNGFFTLELNYYHLVLSSVFTIAIYPAVGFTFNFISNLISSEKK